MRVSSRFARLLSASLSVAMLSACVPTSMHVTRGTDPRYINDDVRFRTTYYFRTFDYCWDAGLSLSQLGDDGVSNISYRDIIPQTDTLYRYRMTGKAASRDTKVRFESGTLRKEEIEPFGKQITYSDAGNGFYIRDSADVREAEERAQTEQQRQQKINQLEQLFIRFKDSSAKIKEELEKQIVNAIATMSTQPAALPPATADTIRSMANSSNVTNDIRTAVTNLLDQSDAAKKNAENILGPCAIGQKVRKGFQLMGPEGIKTFDQDERLVLAMSSSAKPLIAALQEYSGRILDPRKNGTSQRLAVTDEILRTVRARESVADAQRSGGAKADTLINAAITTLSATNNKGAN